MEGRSGKVWHKFAEEKPTKNGFYAAINIHGFVSTLLYYTESGVFNWKGKGEDTTIEVEYWAELQDVIESARL